MTHLGLTSVVYPSSLTSDMCFKYAPSMHGQATEVNKSTRTYGMLQQVNKQFDYFISFSFVYLRTVLDTFIPNSLHSTYNMHFVVAYKCSHTVIIWKVKSCSQTWFLFVSTRKTTINIVLTFSSITQWQHGNPKQILSKCTWVTKTSKQWIVHTERGLYAWSNTCLLCMYT